MFKILRPFVSIAIMCTLLVAGCTPREAPTARPTHGLSAPTLEASPTVAILTSDQLYGQETPRFGVNDPTAASLPSGQELPPLDSGTRAPNGVQGINVILLNGEQVAGELYQTTDLGRTPAILLLSTTSLVWGTFPMDLQNAGYTVMVLTLPRTDYDANELGEMLNTLGLVGTVDPSKMAVIAEVESADFALRGCASSLLCDALVMLSPVNRDSNLNAISIFSPRPLLLIVAQDDAISYPTALALSGVTQGTSTFLEYTTGSGSGLLTLNADLENQIINWLREKLI